MVLNLPFRAFLVLSAVLIFPLLLPGGPPLVDYPNHLARMKVAFEPDALTQQFYDFDWIVVGNLGLEGIVWALSHIMPVEPATECAVAVAIILPVIGMGWLSQTLHGRLTIPCLLGLVFVWSGVLQFGFLSYSLGIGLATCAIAFWVATEDRPLLPRVAIGALLCLAMFFAHLLAFVFYGIALASYMIGRIFWRRDRSLAALLTEAAIAGSQALPTLAVMVLSNRGGGPSRPMFWPLVEKVKNLGYLMYQTWDLLLLASLAMCAALFFAAIFRYRWPFPPRMLGPILALVAAYMVLPIMLGHGPSIAWGVDWRMLPFIAWLCCASLRDPVAPRYLTWSTVAVSGFVLLSLGGMAGKHWFGWVKQEAELRACLQRMSPGQSIISFFFPVNDETVRVAYRPPAMIHAAAWAVTDRSAYVPSLFAFRFQQPLSYDAPRRALAEAYPAPLLDPAATIDPKVVAQFDYVLGVFPLPDRSVPSNVSGLLGPALCEGKSYALFPVIRVGSGSD